ncbi:hypothetical protein O181_083985 [Austropuccinia psidii MF-1]|uniref:Uncharacterized protein n=1 Tax=Austropuccinia psidii MF-1 TaxID=1389203 RepID=A0A9Q3IM33_9BASI|nr:hypothetical protein [Austropuccinia psidii MF-1]
MLEKGLNPMLPADTRSKYLVNIHPTAYSFKMMLEKVKQHAKKMMLLTMQIRRPFLAVSLHGTNAIQVELSGESENNNPTFPVRLIKPYQPADKEVFPLRNPTPLTVPPVEQSEDKKMKKFIK